MQILARKSSEMLDFCGSGSSIAITLHRFISVVSYSSHKIYYLNCTVDRIKRYLDSFCGLQVTGLTTLILTAHSYSALYSEEVFFCTIVIISFMCSFALLIAHLLLLISDKTLRVKYFVSSAFTLFPFETYLIPHK